ncbi:MAG: SulP family inorganic anion transporter [Anaerolineae bacterium]
MAESHGKLAQARQLVAVQAQRYVPILSWLPRYSRDGWQPDLISGLTIGGTMIPVALAYAEMAGVPAQSGLYAAFAAIAAYAIFGTSRQLKVTTSSTMAVMSAAVVAPLAAGGSDAYLALSSALAMIVGLILMIAGFARLGFISDFLSKSVVTGFIFGLALTIAIGQAPKLFGVPSGSGNFFQQTYQLLLNLPQTNPYTFAIGAGAIALILILKRRFARIPAALVALAVGILAVTLLNLDAKGVSVVGEIPTGLPTPTIPRIGIGSFFFLLAGAAGIVFLAVGESLGAARAFATRHRYDIQPNQELIALGVANLSAGVMQGFTVDASLSQTAAADAAGARTQLSGLVTAGVIVLTLLFLAPLFYNLPNSVLAAVVITSVIGLMDVGELKRYAQMRRTDLLVALTALFGVLATDVLTGLVIAVLLSLILLLYRASRPYIAILGQVPEKPGEYGDVGRHARYAQVSGLLLMRVDAPLYFFNANVARDQILSQVAATHPRAVVLDIGASADLDISTTDMLHELAATLRDDKVDLMLAQARGSVRDRLRKTGTIEVIGEHHIYRSIESAVHDFVSRQEGATTEVGIAVGGARPPNSPV